MKILVSNVGSTSLKFKLFEMPKENVLCTGKVERVGSDDAIFSYTRISDGYTDSRTPVNIPSYSEGIGLFIECMTDRDHGVADSIKEVEAVGFKTVAAKGFYGIHLINDDVLSAMNDYMSIAPAHNAAYLEAIGCFRKMLPDEKFIGVFETAFHRTIPLKRKLYSVPYEWYEKYGVQKLGYHGASHSYAASVLEEEFGTTGKAVTCHLGGSCSLCAVEDGKSVDTSFGMSLQVGLPQNNRAGDLDPYVIRYLETCGLTEDEVFQALTSKSGLLGVSGVGRDLRYLMSASDEGNERAKLAVQMFIESLLHYIGAYAAEMGGLDNLVFTGGIGENSVFVREKVCEKLGFMGLVPDKARNEDPGTGRIRRISADGSKVNAFVIPADEEIVVVRKTYEYLQNEG